MSDFVSFEIAKKLKDKGFREECLYHYPCSGGDYAYANCCPGDDVNTDYLYQCNNKDSDRLIDAPTISQVLKWLRDEKGIHVCIALGEFSDWMYDVSRIDGNMFCKAEDDFKSYEQATLAGVNYCLDNLI